MDMNTKGSRLIRIVLLMVALLLLGCVFLTKTQVDDPANASLTTKAQGLPSITGKGMEGIWSYSHGLRLYIDGTRIPSTRTYQKRINQEGDYYIIINEDNIVGKNTIEAALKVNSMNGGE